MAPGRFDTLDQRAKLSDPPGIALDGFGGEPLAAPRGEHHMNLVVAGDFVEKAE
jgi:hypothetical protein